VAWADCEVYTVGVLRGRGPAINKTPWCSILFKYRQYLKLNPLTIQIFRSVRPILNMRSVLLVIQEDSNLPCGLQSDDVC
jgi:hypothetical protein